MSLVKEYKITRQNLDFYIDHLINNKKITGEEMKIINDSRKKYRIITSLNFFVFAFTIKQIYKNTKPKEFSHLINFQIFRFCTLATISMTYIFAHANNEYYVDTKYLISKHFSVDEKKYNESNLNREIMKLYVS